MPLLLYGGGNRAGSRSYRDRGTSHGPGVEGPGVINSVNDRLPVNTRARPESRSPVRRRRSGLLPRTATSPVYYYYRLLSPSSCNSARTHRPQRLYRPAAALSSRHDLCSVFGALIFRDDNNTTTTAITERKTRSENVCVSITVAIGSHSNERIEFRSNVIGG